MHVRVALVAAALLLGPLAGAADDAAPRWLVVQYAGPVGPEEKAALAAHAGVVLEHVPPFGFLVRLDGAGRAALEARPEVVDVSPLPREARMSREAAGEWPALRVLLYPDAEPSRFAAHLAVEGVDARVPHEGLSVVDVAAGRRVLAHLLEHEEVRWVEPLRQHATLDAARASSIVQGGTNVGWSVHARGVNGSSQVVAYCDTGLDTDAPVGLAAGRASHELFAHGAVPLAQNAPSPLHRKVALYYAPLDEGGLRGDLDDADGHGTHMGGILAGDAGAWGARDGNDGVAFASRLAVCDVSKGRSFQVLSDPSPYWAPAYDAGARVHSNSWGTSPSDEYLLTARQHDAFAWAHRDFLVLRSMGNAGPDGLMRPEASAKNVFAVGATRNDADAEAVEAFSARGPAADGRVKPDLVAPGACVTSASIGQGAAGYACLSGTSQATAVAAGAAALVRDYYAKGHHPTGAANEADARSPTAALVRATLVAGAVPVSSPVPDGAEGWGRIELARALAFGDRRVVVHDEEAPLATGEAWTFTLAVPSPASLRVVLAWTDAPAGPGAAVALVNDLDLEVETPDGRVLRGNADLAAPDRRNVVERVVLDDAAAGQYVVRVRGWSVPMGPQPFALVVVQEEK